MRTAVRTEGPMPKSAPAPEGRHAPQAVGEDIGPFCTPACPQRLEEGLGPALSLQGPILLLLGRLKCC